MQKSDVVLYTWCARAKFFRIHSTENYISLDLPMKMFRRDLPCISINLGAATQSLKPHISIAKDVPNISLRHCRSLFRCLENKMVSKEDEYMELQFVIKQKREPGKVLYLANHCSLAGLVDELREIFKVFVPTQVPDSITNLKLSQPHVTLAAENIVVPLVTSEKREEHRWHMQFSPDMQSAWWLDWVDEKVYFNVDIHDVNLSVWREPETGLQFEYDSRTNRARILFDEELSEVIAIPYRYDLQRQWPLAMR